MKDEFAGFDSNDVDKWLQNMMPQSDHPTEAAEDRDPSASKPEKERMVEGMPNSPDYERIKVMLTDVFTECEKLGWSIQVAMSTKETGGDGTEYGALTLCGHLTPSNVPCEMIAAAAVYQSNHIFSHMVLAAASAGAPLISLGGSDQDGKPS